MKSWYCRKKLLEKTTVKTGIKYDIIVEKQTGIEK